MCRVDMLGTSGVGKGAAGASSDMRSIILEFSGGGKWAYATAGEPARMLEHTHVNICMMTQPEVCLIRAAFAQPRLQI